MPSHATTTVAGYLARRLTDAGVRSVFGTGGGDDPVLSQAITTHPELTWIETTTEQAAGDAAAAYARLRGLGATLTATRPPRTGATPAPVVHIVTAPQAASQLTGQLDLPAEVAAAEIDRMLAAALRSGSPVYLSIPADVAVAPVPIPAGPLPAESPDSGPLSWASVWAAVQDFLAPDDVLVADQCARLIRTNSASSSVQIARTDPWPRVCGPDAVLAIRLARAASISCRLLPARPARTRGSRGSRPPMPRSGNHQPAAPPGCASQ